AALTEFRRKIVAERGSDTLRLQSVLKQYFPFLSPLLDQQPTLALQILLRWPTLAELKRVRPSRLQTLLKEHGLRNEEQQTEFIHAARYAVPLPQDPALIEPLALYAQSLARRIADLTRTIAQFEAQIAAETAQHPDQKIFRSLPGAGDALVPRL